MRVCRVCGYPFPRYPGQVAQGICEDCQREFTIEAEAEQSPRPPATEDGSPADESATKGGDGSTGQASSAGASDL